MYRKLHNFIGEIVYAIAGIPSQTSLTLFSSDRNTP